MATNGNPLVDILRQQQAAQAPPPVVGPQLVNVPAPVADAARTPTKTELAPKFVPPAAAPAVPSLVNAPPGDMDQAVADQPVKPLGAPGKLSYMPLGSAPPTPDEAEHARLNAPPVPGNRQASTGQAGVDQIKHAAARIPLQILNAIGSGFFPNVAAFIPGTSTHHQLLVNQNDEALGQDRRIAANNRLQEEEPLKNAATMASTEADLAKPELARANAERAAALTQVAQDKETEAERAHQADEKERSTKNQGVLTALARKQGMVPDEANPGHLRSITPDEMTPIEKSAFDYKSAQGDLAQARQAMVEAKTKNIPQEMANAQRHLAIAEANAGLRRDEYLMHANNTDSSGRVLAGAPIDQQGQSVGTANAKNVMPTAVMRNKGELAVSANEQLDDMKSMVQKRPDIFGPVAGRKMDFQTWLGSEDPDAKRFQAARTVAGDHLAGAFGGHSEYATKALDDAIGRNIDNPAAIMAGLDQVARGNDVFLRMGAPRTQGDGTAAPPKGGGKVPTVSSQKEFDALPKGAVYMEDGKQYRKP